jgi:hypothetical protein
MTIFEDLSEETIGGFVLTKFLGFLTKGCD